MNWVIDRFEGEFAVIELPDQGFLNVPRTALPLGASEGDALLVKVDSGETKKRRDRIKNMMNDLFE